ncbi:MAG: acyl-CoA synthetase (AMP-forming)/AMP-acid ligase II [Kiritimatiellia bacterium]|jgi:acyl-CoA synthetase (AMP-forming)/AMP-acid ligase II
MNELCDWLLSPHSSTSPCLILEDGRVLNRGDVRRAVERRADDLRNHVPHPGAIVGICAQRPSQLLIDVLAVMMTGAVATPVAPWNDRPELWTKLGACAVLAAKQMPTAVRPLSGMRHLHESLALMMTTSGTTATPRRVLLRANGVKANVQAILGTLTFDASTRHGLVLAPWYAYALIGQWFTCLRGGASLALVPPSPFAGERLAHIDRLQVDSLSAVPSMLRALCEAPGRRPVLRTLASAGAPLHARTREAMDAAFPEALLWNQYGCTEAGPRIAAISSRHEAFWRGAAGVAIAGVDVVCHGVPDEPEEIVVWSPSTMQGYLGEPTATHRALTPDGLRTGDLGWMDGEALFVKGRADDLVKIGGVRLHLSAVRAALLNHEAVRDAAVLSVPDEQSGVRIIAAVVSDDVEDVRSWCRRELPSHMRPRKIVAVEALPFTDRGKIDNAALHEMIA